MAAYDLIAIGGGAGGLSAVRSARWAGRSAALVTDGEPGGDCTFTGCVPSKALLSVAGRGGSFAEAMAHVHKSIDVIAATETMAVLRADGVDVYDGRASFVDATTVDVDGTQLRADRIVIATGARPAMPPIPGLDQIDVLTNETVFDLDTAPASMIVVGGGPVGCELSQAMARLGVQVTLIEALDRVLSTEEPDASRVVQAALEADGVQVQLGAMGSTVVSIDGAVELTTPQGVTTRAERLLMAAGRVPVTDGLGLHDVGVALDDRGHIVVDEHLRTSVDGVYAVGDVTGRMPFTHGADEMGRLAAGHALRVHPRWAFRPEAVPFAVFTDPEVARVGVTEAEAAALGGRVAELPMSEFDRGIVEDRTEGFIKIITGPRRVTRHWLGGRVIGATVVGPRAGELINELALAVRTGMFTARLATTVHAYPTWGMAIPQTATQFLRPLGGREARPARRR